MSLQPLRAQQLDQIGKGKALKISGGLSVSQNAFWNKGRSSSRSPYSLLVNGNLNVDLWGFAVPLSFTYTNEKLDFQQPFNRLSLSPAYKWLTAHIGHSSMTFSPYTLGGHSFFGLGVEARPSS
ncbi:MAG: hypothetical protein MI784_08490, partial [Cytophagales bacterium]|nr:hypothetical protein [Cytophagales bacterium]